MSWDWLQGLKERHREACSGEERKGRSWGLLWDHEGLREGAWEWGAKDPQAVLGVQPCTSRGGIFSQCHNNM